MLLSLLYIPSLFAGDVAVDGRPAGYESPSYALGIDGVGGDGTLRSEMLDLDLEKGLVAWKLVQAPNSDWDEEELPMSATKCAYAGMENPYAGVSLVLFDLVQSRAQRFDVYPSVSDASECATQAQSEQVLADAKAAFAAAGLDIARRPQPILPGEDGGFSFEVDGQAVAIDAWSFTAHAADEARYAQLTGTSDSDFAESTAWVGLMRGDAVLFTVENTYSRNMAGNLQVRFVRAWQQGDRVVFEVETVASDMRSPPSHTHTFSPVVSLK